VDADRVQFQNVGPDLMSAFSIGVRGGQRGCPAATRASGCGQRQSIHFPVAVRGSSSMTTNADGSYIPADGWRGRAAAC